MHSTNQEAAVHLLDCYNACSIIVLCVLHVVYDACSTIKENTNKDKYKNMRENESTRKERILELDREKRKEITNTIKSTRNIKTKDRERVERERKEGRKKQMHKKERNITQAKGNHKSRMKAVHCSRMGREQRLQTLSSCTQCEGDEDAEVTKRFFISTSTCGAVGNTVVTAAVAVDCP